MRKVYYILSAAFFVLIIMLGVFPQFRTTASSFLYGGTIPITKTFSSISNALKDNFRFISQIKGLKRQNDDLTTKLQSLEVDKSQIIELEKENQILKEEIGFMDENKEGQLIPAKIIVREPTSFFDNIIVDKGSDDGVILDTAVVSNGALIGQVKEVFPRSARIVLITSKDSLIQAMLQESRAKGILKGGISGLFLQNIVSDTDYRTGEYVVTSGLGGKINQGILIGKVSDIQSNSSEIFKSFVVEPIVDFSRLELVFIIK